MPEVRHGSFAAARSDPVLPSLNTGTPSNSNLVDGGSVGNSVSNPPVGSPPGTTTRPAAVHQLSSRSADTAAPITKQVSPMRRLSHAISGRSLQNGVTSPTSPDGNYDPSAGGRKSLSYALREPAEAYYDSRAAGQKEYKRRAKDLQEYYDDNPHLLPQLPFSWHHGNRRWRLWFFAFCVFVDASAVPIALYYGMRYAGGVANHIIFIIVTTVWGGPTYLEFAIRTLRLIKKERFYRPLGTESRWACDMTTWVASLTIFVLTALFVVGSAPRHTWLRVVAMAAVSILWCLGGVLLYLELLHMYKKPAPFRISSTAKGEPVNAGCYYFIEDVLAVNGGAGRPYREALAARYKASPRFRRMLHEMGLFWSIPALALATILTFVACLPWVPEDWAYGVCWVAPFLWGVIWGCITIPWCKRHMVKERLEWEAGKVPEKLPLPSMGSESAIAPAPALAPAADPAPVPTSPLATAV